MRRAGCVYLALWWSGLSVLGVTSHVSAQILPTQAEILSSMRSANDYFMSQWPDPTQNADPTHPSNIWTRGTYYEGLLALYGVDPQLRYYDYAVEWGDFHRWRPRGGTSTTNADNQCAGQTYIELYQLDPDHDERILPIKQTIDNMLASPANNQWSWIDALQMAMPVFAKLGTIYDDDRYFEKMFDIYNYTKTVWGSRTRGSGLYNTVDHL